MHEASGWAAGRRTDRCCASCPPLLRWLAAAPSIGCSLLLPLFFFSWPPNPITISKIKVSMFFILSHFLAPLKITPVNRKQIRLFFSNYSWSLCSFIGSKLCEEAQDNVDGIRLAHEGGIRQARRLSQWICNLDLLFPLLSFYFEIPAHSTISCLLRLTFFLLVGEDNWFFRGFRIEASSLRWF